MTTAQTQTQPSARLDVTILSADDCQGRYSIALVDSRRLETQIQWLPFDPLLQTESISFDLSGTRFVESSEAIDGNTWRSLESFGLLEKFTTRLLDGEPAEDVAAELLAGL